MPKDFSYYNSNNKWINLRLQVGQKWSDAAGGEDFLNTIFSKIDKIDGESDGVISERELNRFQQLISQFKSLLHDDIIAPDAKDLEFLANNLENSIEDGYQFVVKGKIEDKTIHYNGYKVNLLEYNPEKETWYAEFFDSQGNKISFEDFRDATSTSTLRVSTDASEYSLYKENQVYIKTTFGKIVSDYGNKITDFIGNHFSIVESPRQIYDKLGLKEKGMSWEVFEMAMEGYKNLPEDKKSTGMLGIFDTTQSADKERYYLIDLNKGVLVGRSGMKTGKGKFMGDIPRANQEGSNSTLSGFESVGREYKSVSMNKQAKKLEGMEKGINDKAMAKGTVVHYASGNFTLGCKGFTPVRNPDGSVNIKATNEKMETLFPEGTILFTFPTDPRYKELSDFV